MQAGLGSQRVEGAVMRWRVCFSAGLLVASLGPASMLGGCAGFGNETIADASPRKLSAQLIKGRTRQDHVREMYGEPAKITFTDNGLEVWEYDYSRLLASRRTDSFPYVSIDGGPDKKSLTIFFSKGKIVQKYSLNNSKIDLTGGLASQ
jgi:hypothetical protein